ncbi:hypothetical protein AB5J49_41880 [Streptomyces sp. R28]|uniref:Uncharacterized protein n=1 Tax=Streptomyces sp. R28 TaxID=3238628 RepID=A0AB39QAN4_9ACTN
MSEGLVEGCAPRAVPEGGEDPPPDLSRSGLQQLSAVADAVLYEGYLLYPYRRSSAKNRVRWQFGVLFPRDWVEAAGPVVPGVSGSADSWYQRTECLLRVRGPGAVVRVKVRYLQMQHKQVETAGPDGSHRAVASLRTDDGVAHLTFDEAVPREVDLTVPLDDLLTGDRTAAVGASAGTDIEPLPGGAGRVVRRREEVRAHTTLAAERLAEGVYRLTVLTANTGPAPEPHTPRDEALRGALIATHTLIAGQGVEFASLIDPPAPLEEHARACRNEFAFPVLGGEPPAEETGAGATADLLLASPIILPDHPQVAPESPGDLHDAAEIDEILTLRTMLLTDEEKSEARATDPRAAAILDRVDTMPPEVFARLHGAVRSLTPVTRAAEGTPPPSTPAAVSSPSSGPPAAEGPPSPATPATVDPLSPATPAAEHPTPPVSPTPERPAWWQEGADAGLCPTTDTVLVDGVPVGGGSRVRLRPRGRGADAQDMFLVGRTAEVAAVFHDVDGSTHLAVTLDDDPAAELHTWYGRFHYFRPDELEPLEPTDSPTPPQRRPMT